MDPSSQETAHAAKEVEEFVAEKIDEHVQEKVPSEAAESPPISARETKEFDSRSSASSSSRDEKPVQKLDSRIIPIEKIKTGEEAYAHLPPHEREIIKRQLDIPTVKVGIKELYRYATVNDLIIVFIASLGAIIGGAALPLMTILFGNLAGTFQGFFNQTITQADFNSQLSGFVLYFVYLAVGEFVTIYAATLGYIYTGEHITQKIREQYLAAILRQNMGFFDTLGAGEITTRITADTNLIQEGISEKVSLTLSALATFFAAFVVGFIKYWKLTLICSSTVFALTAVMGGGSVFMVKYTKLSLESYAKGGSVVEEVVSSIRNAIAFGTQDKLARQYDSYLKVAEKFGRRMQIALGLMIGGMFWVLYLNYGLSFWQGARFVVAGETNLSSVLTILMAIMIGAFALGNVAPNGRSFGAALSAAAKIYSTIDRKSPLDPTSDDGKRLDDLEGSIELKNVKHIYPSRPEVVVMRDVSLKVPYGKTTALVGTSGSGKSTIIGLVERFYDPVGGEVLLDGHNIQDLNLQWLRQQIALVSQEPTLFGTTIEGNIRHGLIGTKYENVSPEKQKELVIEAAKMANAHDFITNLPEGYETNVGERGFLLSGGQKQRIAIARAMVSDPKILLLDEATSALDTKSEGVVQAALDVAAKGRTTIVIAHRLSTIKSADNIVVMSQGRVVEQGNHDELLEQEGVYYKLVEAQRFNAKRQEAAAEADEESHADEVEMALDKTATKQSAHSKIKAVDPDDANIANKLNRSTTEQSLSSVALKTKGPEGGKRYGVWTLVKLTASFNKEEKAAMIVGLVFSVIAGGGNPTQAVFFAKALTNLALPSSQYDTLQSEVSFWALMYLMLAFAMLIAFTIQNAAFGYCSERLVHRVRDRAFRTMMRQDIAFFDREENSAGALTSFLSTEATHLAGLSGATLGTILVVLTTLIAATAVALAVGWKLALVCTATIPVVLACGFFRFWILARFAQRSKKAYGNSASFACEATSAVRTVASLTRERDVWEHYHRDVEAQCRRSLISVSKSSTLYAFSQSFMFLCIALGFWYGGTLIGSGEYSMFQFFLCFSAVIFGAQSAGTVFSFAPDMGKAKQAAQELKTLFDRVPIVDTWSEDGERAETIEGNIEFRDVHFRYPTRTEQPVLRGLNLSVKPGQYVALVGASGCGKSTTIQLLERFYDALSGGVFVDGKDVASYNINNYRGFLALVSQEPTLYQGSIKENIMLGVAADEVPEERIVQACKDANIYDFIMSLPYVFAYPSPFCPVFSFLRSIGMVFPPSSAPRAACCLAVRNSASPSHVRSFAIRRSCCSTRPHRRSTPSRRKSCRRRSTPRRRVAPPLPLRTVSAPSRTRI